MKAGKGFVVREVQGQDHHAQRHENSGTSFNSVEYIVDSQGQFDVKRTNVERTQSQSLMEGIKSFFLPEGYPTSVSRDYLSFQVWDTIQAVCSYLRGMLCTQAILLGVGVGKSQASATSAAIQWVFRDGLGMFGGMLFAWARASSFGADIKQWRMFADAINDIGLTLELLSPLWPDYFLVLASLGSVCKAMCGVAAGSTRAALSLHFARSHNLSDISAKEGIQETAVTLVGLVLGMWFAELLGSSVAATWFTFLALTVLHVYANYQGVRALALTTLNRQRSNILLDNYFSSACVTGDGEVPGNLVFSCVTHTVLSPAEVSEREHIVWIGDMRTPHINIGTRFNESCHDARHLEALVSCQGNRSEKFLMSVSNDSKHINICLHLTATPVDVFRAYFIASIVRLIIRGQWTRTVADQLEVNSKFLHSCPGYAALTEAHSFAAACFDSFWSEVGAKGWERQTIYLIAKNADTLWRCDWKYSE